MKRLLCLSAATLMLAGLWTEPAQSLDHPYWGPAIVVADGPSPDHPWGGDNASGGEITPSKSASKQSLIVTTGFAPVDLMLSLYRTRFAARMWPGKNARIVTTSQPSVITTTTTSAAGTNSENGSSNN
jgi:hypothetical protein